MLGAVDGRDGAAPEPLARHEPVTDPVVDLALADPSFLEPLDREGLGRGDVEPVQEVAVDLLALARVRPAAVLVPAGRWLDRPHDREPVELGEGPVTLVLGRHGHDGAGAVPHEDIVGHVDRDRGPGEGVDHAAAGEGAPLVERAELGFDGPVDVAGHGGPLAQLLDGGPTIRGRERVEQGVFGRHDRIGHAEAGVGSRGEDPQAQLLVPLDGEVELRPLRSPDPVALHGLDALGPLEVVESLQELVGVGGDAEEPLLQIALFDEVARALAGAVGQDLLVGQHGLAARAPVDRGEGAVGQARLPEPEEDQLGPVDVGGVVAVHLPAPVVDGTETEEGGLQLGDAGIGERPRVGPRPYGGVLGREAERIEAEGAEHALPEHGLVPDGQVAEGVVPHVPLVGRARGVGIHAQRVVLLPRIVVVDPVGAFFLPVALPLLLNCNDVERPGHPTRVGEAIGVPERSRADGAESKGTSGDC